MGLFFDQVPSQAQVDILADAFMHDRPPTNELDTQVVQYLQKLDGARVTAVSRAVDSGALDAEQAKASARAALAHTTPPVSTKFHPWRFAIALMLFGALVGGGVAADASHLNAASAALFGFAGSVFGVVTAFLGAEKGP